MNFKISFSGDDLDLTQAIQTLTNNGYTPQGAVKQIMRKALALSTQTPPMINVNVNCTQTGLNEDPVLADDGPDQDPDEFLALTSAFSNAFNE